MKATRTDFPRAVSVIEDVWIPMADGCRLAAKLWLPEDAEQDPVPALLEYIPYRKNDGTAVGDSARHTYFAGHGYASVRVDLRGSGDSEGVLLDEYLPQEQEDAVEVLAWLAAQPWCTGSTGMFGISWGGFNSLQVAARRPPSLKAIITICSTDDRYADDVHYMGGCLLGVEALSWASTMLAFNARPPDPEVVGDRWRDMWLERLEGSPPFIEAWLAHQRRDAFWKQGSVCEDYSAIECAVYAVGGWADPYRNAIFRLLEGLAGPHKALVGPWSHNYPEDGIPGPAIGFLQEALRWWDHWLKGIDTGIMDEPVLRAWMQGPAVPAPYYDERPGRWVAEPTWPAAGIEAKPVELGIPGAERVRLRAARAPGRRLVPVRGPRGAPARPARRGRAVPLFRCGAIRRAAGDPGIPGGRADALLGPTPGARLRASLRHRSRRKLPARHPRPAQPHPPRRPRAPRRARARTALHASAFAWASSPTPSRPDTDSASPSPPTYWPWAWPSPEPATLTIHDGRLHLPVRPPRPDDDALPPFAAPEAAEPIEVEMVRAKESGCEIRTDFVRGGHELVFRQDYGGRRRLPDGLEFETFGEDGFTIVAGDPLSALTRSERIDGLARGDWRVRVETSSVLTADADSFLVTNTVDAYEGDVRVFAKTWSLAVPRDHN